jgi:2-polyprenyl-6-methoxyphenol hydroxylase-like FAD-dependent oxidoreductase
MGLNTGLLDADALSEAPIMIVAESRSDELLTLYSDERRRIFQSFVDPATTANKLRMQQPFSTPYTVRYEDSFFRILQNAGPATIKGLVRPFFETWPTDMRAVAREHGL